MNNKQRKKRTRVKLKKISNRKRLTVFKSNSHFYAQIINDELGTTLTSVSSLEKTFKDKKVENKKDLIEILGKEIAKRSLENGIKEVSFDKGQYKYHGIIKIFAEAARANGLDF